MARGEGADFKESERGAAERGGRYRLFTAVAVGVLGAISAAAEVAGQENPRPVAVALWSAFAIGGFGVGLAEYQRARREDRRRRCRELAARQRAEEARSKRRRDPLDQHFGPRARGVLPAGARRGWYFTGRRAALAELAGWLSRPDGSDHRVRIVTGGPGSGKSAVLGRLVVLSSPQEREGVPADELAAAEAAGTVPALGAVRVSVHARGLTAVGVAQRIAEGLGVQARDPIGLLVALDARVATEPSGIIVDALDEASEPEVIAREVLARLAEVAGSALLRLVVATRSGTDGRLVELLGVDRVEIDLDDPSYQGPVDLTSYAEKLLVAAADPRVNSPYRNRPRVARQVAEVVAAKAGHSFLVAQLASLALARAGQVVDPVSPQWRDSLPRSAGAAMEQYLDQFGSERTRVRDLLMPLAYAEGNGLSDPVLWARLATLLGTRTYSPRDIAWLFLDTTAHGLLHRMDQPEAVCYRLFHDALAEHLRRRLEAHRPARAIQASIAAEILASCPDQHGGDGKQWNDAGRYAWTYLASHAAAGGVLDPLLADPAYLAVADAGQLLRALPAVATAEGRRLARIVTRAGRNLLLADRTERPSYLELAARKQGEDVFADTVAAGAPGRPWRVPWAWWLPTGDYTVVGQHAGYIDAVDLDTHQDELVVFSASRTDGALVWASGSQPRIHTPFDDHPALVVSLLHLPHPHTPRTVTSHQDGTIAFWTGYPPRLLSTTAVGSTPGGPGLKATHPPGDPNAAEHPVVCLSVSGELSAWSPLDGDRLPFPPIQVSADTNLYCAGTVGGRLVAILSSDRHEAQLWDLVLGQPVGRTFGSATDHDNCWLWSAAIARLDERDVIITGCQRRPLHLWDGDTVELRHELPLPLGWGPATIRVDQVGDQPILVAGCADAIVDWWRWTDGAFVSGPPLIGHEGGVDAVAIGAFDGRLAIVSGGRDGVVRLWWPDLGAAEVDSSAVGLAAAQNHNLLVSRVTDPPRVFDLQAGTGQLDEVDPATGRILGSWTLENPDEMGHAVLAHRDGELLLVRGDGRPALRLSGPDIGSLAPNIPRPRFVSIQRPHQTHHDSEACLGCRVNDGKAGMLDLDTLTVHHLNGVDFTRRTRFNLATVAGRRVVVSAGPDPTGISGTITLRDLTDDTPAKVIDQYDPAEANYHGLAIGRHDGRTIAVTVGDGSHIRVCDLDAGTPLDSFILDDGHSMALDIVLITRLHDNDLVIVAGYAGAITFWNISRTIQKTIEVGTWVTGIHVLVPGTLLVSGPLGTIRLDTSSDFFGPVLSL